jgi:hypothetical protein
MKGTFLVDEDGGVRNWIPMPEEDVLDPQNWGGGSNVYTDEEWEDWLLEMEGIE